RRCAPSTSRSISPSRKGRRVADPEPRRWNLAARDLIGLNMRFGRLAMRGHTENRKARGSIPRAFRFGMFAPGLDLAFHHELLDLRDCLGGVEPLRAGLRTVHDGVAAIEAERILEVVEALARHLIAGVRDPAVSLQQDGRAEVTLAVPPVARARGLAAE